MTEIKNINLAITSKCNLKCIMCDIWKQQDCDIELLNLEKILTSKILAQDVDIAITGGEPFLHSKFKEILDLFYQTNKKIATITTNGVMVSEIISNFDYIKSRYDNKILSSNFCLNFSVDSLNNLSSIRGISANRIFDNIKKIKDKFPYLNINIKSIILPNNKSEIVDLYRYVRKLGLGFKLKPVENQFNYTNKISRNNCITKKDKIEIVLSLKNLIKEAKRNNDLEVSTRAYEIAEYISKKNFKNKKHICNTPFDRIFVMPNGDIFTCLYFDVLGNIRSKNLKELFDGEVSNKIRKSIKNTGCIGCIAYHGKS